MFRVGDLVERTDGYNYHMSKGDRGTIIRNNNGFSDIRLQSGIFSGGNDNTYLKKVTKTIRDVEVGDIIYNTEAVYKNVMANSGRLVALSCDNHLNKDFVGSWQSMESLERGEWKIKGQVETITIADKTYNKAEVEKRLAELTPIE